jgi:hypothetical protein
MAVMRVKERTAMKYFAPNITLFPEFLGINHSLTQRILIYNRCVINRKILTFADEVNHG